MNLFADILRGDRIELRVLKPTFENVNTIWAVYEPNIEFINEFDSDDIDTKEKYLIFLNNVSKPESTNKDWFIFVDDKLVGHINIWAYSAENEKCVIAYWFAKSETGKGYIAEALKLLESELFNNGINRIELGCDAENIASRKVAERNNYILEGIRRKNHKDKDGNFSDAYFYAKLKDDK